MSTLARPPRKNRYIDDEAEESQDDTAEYDLEAPEDAEAEEEDENDDSDGFIDHDAEEEEPEAESPVASGGHAFLLNQMSRKEHEADINALLKKYTTSRKPTSFADTDHGVHSSSGLSGDDERMAQGGFVKSKTVAAPIATTAPKAQLSRWAEGDEFEAMDDEGMSQWQIRYLVSAQVKMIGGMKAPHLQDIGHDDCTVNQFSTCARIVRSKPDLQQLHCFLIPPYRGAQQPLPVYLTLDLAKVIENKLSTKERAERKASLIASNNRAVSKSGKTILLTSVDYFNWLVAEQKKQKLKSLTRQRRVVLAKWNEQHVHVESEPVKQFFAHVFDLWLKSQASEPVQQVLDSFKLYHDFSAEHLEEIKATKPENAAALFSRPQYRGIAVALDALVHILPSVSTEFRDAMVHSVIARDEAEGVSTTAKRSRNKKAKIDHDPSLNRIM